MCRCTEVWKETQKAGNTAVSPAVYPVFFPSVKKFSHVYVWNGKNTNGQKFYCSTRLHFHTCTHPESYMVKLTERKQYSIPGTECYSPRFTQGERREKH